MTGHNLIHADELLAALVELTPCPDCSGGLGICVEPNGDWDAVQVHDVPCPTTSRRRP